MSSEAQSERQAAHVAVVTPGRSALCTVWKSWETAGVHAAPADNAFGQ
jgi:hypothetical protein